MFRRVLSFAALLSAGAGGWVQAQQMTASKIVFRNAGGYAQADLERVAGLHAGSKMVLADIQAAAQRLADTGCFDAVNVDSQGAPGALTVIFILKPSAGGSLYPVAFPNAVWFTPEELQEVVHRAVPLSSNGLPDNTATLDSVAAALVAALGAKGVPDATVRHAVSTASSNLPETRIFFDLQKPYVHWGTVALDGVPADARAAQDKFVAGLRGKPYAGGTESEQTDSVLLHPLLDAGYLEARLEEVQRKVEPLSADQVATVDVAGKVVTGSGVYHVSAIKWEGSALVPASAWDGMAKLRAGDVASRHLLLASVEPIDRAYHKQGYMDEYVDMGAKLDRAAHTVSYDLKAVPGEVYRVRNVVAQGLTPEAQADFDRGWLMKTGTPYDADYVSGFIKGNTALRALAGYIGSFEAAADPTTHEVDLTLVFVKGAVRR
jgi:outer membrane protein assembly factor BamA